MKPLITLLLSACAFAVSSAQPGADRTAFPQALSGSSVRSESGMATAARQPAGISTVMRRTVHWPRHRDKVMKTHYEYTDVPSDTAVWDFSHAVETGEQHEMRWANLGDTLLVKIEEGFQSTYKLSGGTLFWNSYETPLLCVRDSVAPVDALTAVSSGASISSPLYFRGSYCGNHAVDVSGFQSTAVSKPGLLILPNDTVEHVSCVTTTKECLMRVSESRTDVPIHEGADSLLREVEVTMQWYSPLYRYPLAENVSTAYYRGQEQLSRSEQTYLCSPDEQEYSLGTLCVPDPQLKKDLLERSSLAGGTAGQGSPLASRVTIEKDGGRVDVMIDGLGNGASEFTVMLCDVQGRVYQYQKGRASERISMDTGSLNAGYYFIEVSDGSEVTTKGFTNN